MENTPDPPSKPLDGTNSLYRPTADGNAESTKRVVAHVARTLASYASGAPFIAAVAAVETLIATVLLGLPLTPAPAVVALVAFAVYTVDHVADAAADTRSTPERAALAYRYGDQLMIAAALAYGLAVALAVLGGPIALAVTLLPGTLWVLYASDWLPDVGRFAAKLIASGRVGAIRGRLPRLKEVLVLNSVVVALGWAVAVTALPIAFAAENGGPPAGAVAGGLDAVAHGVPLVAVVFVYFLLRSFVDTELPNVRDAEADAAVGVATLPVAFGVAATRRALYGVDVVTATVLAGAAASGLLTPAIAGALLVGIALSIGVTALAGRTVDAATLGFAPDCCYFAVGAMLAGVLLIG